jgi:hypothetical protein
VQKRQPQNGDEADQEARKAKEKALKWGMRKKGNCLQALVRHIPLADHISSLLSGFTGGDYITTLWWHSQPRRANEEQVRKEEESSTSYLIMDIYA